MKQELIVPRPKYPWPTIISPLTYALDEEEKTWYDNDYSNFLPAESIKRYKRQNLVQDAAYMSPTTTNLDHLRPIGRFMIYITVFDDTFEVTPLKEFIPVRDRVFEVMMGEDPGPNEIGILRQMAAARKEWLENGMPQFWIERISTNFHHFMTYGMMEELPYKLSKTYPSLAHYLLIRVYSIGMLPYGDLIEPGTGFALPVHIYNHPIIQRLKYLLSLVLAIQNDIASIRKELSIGTEIVCNIIPILQHEYKISFEEACTEALRIHDEYVKEMVSLRASLPDFSPYQKETDNYVYHMGLMATGCEAWYYNAKSNRYNAHGFIVPPYREAEVPVDFEIKHVQNFDKTDEL